METFSVINILKRYVTRGGNNARIYAYDGVEPYKWHVARYTPGFGWIQYAVMPGGRFREDKETDIDIIEVKTS